MNENNAPKEPTHTPTPATTPVDTAPEPATPTPDPATPDPATPAAETPAPAAETPTPEVSTPVTAPAEAAQTESAQTESAQTESAQTESAQTEAAPTEAAPQNPAPVATAETPSTTTPDDKSQNNASQDKKPQDRKPQDRKPQDRKPQDRKPQDRKVRPEKKQPADVPPFGALLTVKVKGIQDGFLMFDAGLSVPAALSLANAGAIANANNNEPPAEGTQMAVVVDRYDESRKFIRVLAKEEEEELTEILGTVRAGDIIEGRVSGLIKGGLEVKFETIRGFMPASHVNTSRMKDISVLLNEVIKCEVIELDRRNKKILVSRKNVQERERKDARKNLILTIKVGDVRKGRIINLTEYGAFVDMGGVHGLLHVSDMRWAPVAKAEEVVSVGDEIEVKVLRVNTERRRVSLGMKQLTPDPWKSVAEKFPVDSVSKFEIVKLAEFGAFAKITDDINGLIPLSEMSWNRRPMKADEVVKVGQEIEAKVIGIDTKRHRLSLSIRQTGDDPWKGVEERFEPGKTVTGKVSRLLDFGAIVELEGGIEGMIHISELDQHRVNKPGDVVTIGGDVETKVLGVDLGKRKISLSRKALLEPVVAATPAVQKKKRTKPLRGGLDAHFDW